METFDRRQHRQIGEHDDAVVDQREDSQDTMTHRDTHEYHQDEQKPKEYRRIYVDNLCADDDEGRRPSRTT